MFLWDSVSSFPIKFLRLRETGFATSKIGKANPYIGNTCKKVKKPEEGQGRGCQWMKLRARPARVCNERTLAQASGENSAFGHEWKQYRYIRRFVIKQPESIEGGRASG
jgi:hypothetical protein